MNFITFCLSLQIKIFSESAYPTRAPMHYNGVKAFTGNFKQGQAADKRRFLRFGRLRQGVEVL
jgi:hypothetical protein